MKVRPGVKVHETDARRKGFDSESESDAVNSGLYIITSRPLESPY